LSGSAAKVNWAVRVSKEVSKLRATIGPTLMAIDLLLGIQALCVHELES
jgi:hypothetical protein